MASTSVGRRGTGSGSGAGSTVVITTSAQLDAGNVGLLVFVTDNTQTTEGYSSNHSTVADSGGNNWTKWQEYTNGNGAAQDGVTVSIWYLRPASNLASGATITCTVDTANYDRCASAWEFTAAADLTNSASDVANATDASNGFGSVSHSGLSSLSRLYFRGLGKEANSTTQITVSTGFTAITAARSRNNAAAVLVRGEFRINTSTGETSNPTLAVTGDTAGIFLALEESSAAPDPPVRRDYVNQQLQLLAM